MRKKSGFLHLWWTPFYGFGVLISMFLYKLVNKYIKNNVKKNIILFITFFIVFTIFEYIGGISLEKLYGEPFWNYSKMPLHIGKYVSVGTSLLWTIMAFLYIYKLKPLTDKLVNKIPKLITILLTITFIIDCIVSIAKVLH